MTAGVFSLFVTVKFYGPNIKSQCHRMQREVHERFLSKVKKNQQNMCKNDLLQKKKRNFMTWYRWL